MPPISWTSKWRMFELAPRHLAADSEGFRKNVVEGFAGGHPLSEGLSLVGQGVIGKRNQVRFQTVNALDNGHQALDFSVVLTAKNEVEDLRQHRDLQTKNGVNSHVIQAVYRKNFPNPIGKTRASDTQA